MESIGRRLEEIISLLMFRLNFFRIFPENSIRCGHKDFIWSLIWDFAKSFQLNPKSFGQCLRPHKWAFNRFLQYNRSEMLLEDFRRFLPQGGQQAIYSGHFGSRWFVLSLHLFKITRVSVDHGYQGVLGWICLAIIIALTESIPVLSSTLCSWITIEFRQRWDDLFCQVLEHLESHSTTRWRRPLPVWTETRRLGRSSARSQPQRWPALPWSSAISNLEILNWV